MNQARSDVLMDAEKFELSAQERARWDEALKSVEKQWVADTDAMGLPGTKMYNDILQLLPKK